MSVENDEIYKNPSISIEDIYNSGFASKNTNKSAVYYAFEPLINATKWIKKYISNRSSNSQNITNLIKGTNENPSINNVFENIPNLANREEYLDTLARDVLMYAQSEEDAKNFVNPLNAHYKALFALTYATLEEKLGENKAGQLVNMKEKNSEEYFTTIKNVFKDVFPDLKKKYTLQAA